MVFKIAEAMDFKVDFKCYKGNRLSRLPMIWILEIAKAIDVQNCRGNELSTMPR